MTDLHLWKLTLDPRAVGAFARDQRLLHRDTDHGYVTHAALTAALGDHAPAPFVIERTLLPDARPEDVPAEVVLAYSSIPFDAATRELDRTHAGLLRVDRCASKPVPKIESGTRLAFASRVLPTVRTRAPRPGSADRSEGREVDAFLAECFRRPNDRIDREAVYRGWLEKRLIGEGQTFGGAKLETFAMRAWRRARLLRKEATEGSRRRHVLERPDVVLEGTLVVEDAVAFRALLARGIGRHRSFGFGMLLLRRAG